MRRDDVTGIAFENRPDRRDCARGAGSGLIAESYVERGGDAGRPAALTVESVVRSGLPGHLAPVTFRGVCEIADFPAREYPPDCYGQWSIGADRLRADQLIGVLAGFRSRR